MADRERRFRGSAAANRGFFGRPIATTRAGRKRNETKNECFTRRCDDSPDPPGPAFAAEYLRAALDDMDEPRVLLTALRHVAERTDYEKFGGGQSSTEGSWPSGLLGAHQEKRPTKRRVGRYTTVRAR